MSVKYQKEVIRDTVVDGAVNGMSGIRGGGKQEDLAHRVGTALTGGRTSTGYMAAYLRQLQSNPLRTKMLTSGVLSALQEFLASWIAHDKSKHGHYLTPRVPKMALYGAFISAPLGSALINILQWFFAGRTSLRAKVTQILVSNLIVSPIQNTVYLASMAIIAGARTFHQIRATIRAGFLPVMKVSWISSPLALAFAQKFLPEETWVPFFNIIAFVIGTYINAHTKKKSTMVKEAPADETPIIPLLDGNTRQLAGRTGGVASKEVQVVLRARVGL
ncbi:hypothetical protein GP486_004152 [Trichoglossum hirsutum]|uniref:Integral membrane protein n=1 Tax=Trichoglossum hirsutum TaxID=265104 RepID=A0A9P8RPL5_9PEZI|nr:hypothetical protein GP486_004152 [Trichoglossum hirsutum]